MNLGFLRKGFLLPEVMIALTIIAVMLTGLLVLQTRVFYRVTSNTARVNRIYVLKNMFLQVAKEPLEKGQKKKEIVDELFGMKIVYEELPIKEGSSLARFENLIQKKVSGSWYQGERELMQQLITYGFLLPERTEKNA